MPHPIHFLNALFIYKLKESGFQPTNVSYINNQSIKNVLPIWLLYIALKINLLHKMKKTAEIRV